MIEYILHIPNWHPTPINKLLNNHWAKAAILKREDCKMIGAYAHKRKIPKALGKRSVGLHITLGKGQRACDPDAYWKTTLDALVRLGYLTDDNRQGVELMPVEFKRGKMASTIVLGDM